MDSSLTRPRSIGDILAVHGRRIAIMLSTVCVNSNSTACSPRPIVRNTLSRILGIAGHLAPRFTTHGRHSAVRPCPPDVGCGGQAARKDCLITWAVCCCTGPPAKECDGYATVTKAMGRRLVAQLCGCSLYRWLCEPSFGPASEVREQQGGERERGVAASMGCGGYATKIVS